MNFPSWDELDPVVQGAINGIGSVAFVLIVFREHFKVALQAFLEWVPFKDEEA